MKQRYKEILKAYTSLPHIIFRKKYLIPQAPMPPKDNSKVSKLPLYQLIRKDFHHLVDENLVKLATNNEEAKIQEIYYQEIKKLREQYEIEHKKYKETYIKPLKQFAQGLRPQFLYYRDNKAEINKTGAYKSFSKLYELFNALDQDTKRKYEEISNEQLKKQAKIMAQAEAKYKIPEKKFQHPYIIYLREKYEGPINKTMYSLYTVLPQHQKEIYRIKSRKLKEEDTIILEAFLKSKNINMEQFMYIKNICENVRDIKLTLKKLRIQEKGLELGSFDDDQEDES